MSAKQSHWIGTTATRRKKKQLQTETTFPFSVDIEIELNSPCGSTVCAANASLIALSSVARCRSFRIDGGRVTDFELHTLLWRVSFLPIIRFDVNTYAANDNFGLE